MSGAAGAQLVDAPEFPDKPALIQVVPEIETFFLILPYLPPLLVPGAAGARLDDDAHEFPEKSEFPDASGACGASVTLSELDCSGNVPVFPCTGLCAPVPVPVFLSFSWSLMDLLLTLLLPRSVPEGGSLWWWTLDTFTAFT